MTGSNFQFDLYHRNQHLLQNAGYVAPKATSTGTTIVGMIYKDGIVLGADTRATEGPIVADKNCKKIHYLTPYMYCCGAGTAADTEYVTDWMRSSLHLHSLTTGRPSRVITAMTMLKQKLFRYQGHIGAALILGGIDPIDGPQLYTIHPHGSTDKLPFVTMGSGSLAAMSVFESQFKPGMDRDSAIDLVSKAIQAGIFNDLGSGSNVDVVVLSTHRPNNPEILRNHVKPNERSTKERKYLYPRGTTVIISSKEENLVGNIQKGDLDSTMIVDES
jgi:20S proteasome subunit beta 2